MAVVTDKVSDFVRICATQGVGVVAGDWALSGGFGASASVAVSAGSTVTRGEITITSAGAGQAANPTATFTFPNGAYDSVPFVVTVRGGGSQPTVTLTPTTRAAGSVVLTFNGTPVAAETYKVAWICLG